MPLKVTFCFTVCLTSMCGGFLRCQKHQRNNPVCDMLCVSDILSCLCSAANLIMMVAGPVHKLKLPVCLLFHYFPDISFLVCVFHHIVSVSVSACHHLHTHLAAGSQQLAVAVSKPCSADTAGSAQHTGGTWSSQTGEKEERM